MRIAHLLSQAVALLSLATSAYAGPVPATSDAPAAAAAAATASGGTSARLVPRAGPDDQPIGQARPRPPVPSIAELRAQLRVSPDGQLFYSGIRHSRLLPWARGAYPQRRTLAQSWRQAHYDDQFMYDEAVAHEFFIRASTAFAQLAAGHVVVILPHDRQPDPRSIWLNYELPALRANTAVTTIEAVYDDEAHTTRVIFDRTASAARRSSSRSPPRSPPRTPPLV
jgi:hypothetical protein